jgi:hypothetical protein
MTVTNVLSRIWLVLQSARYQSAGAGFSDTRRALETTINRQYLLIIIFLFLENYFFYLLAEFYSIMVYNLYFLFLFPK